MFRRLFGTVLIVTASIGILFSLVSLVGVWTYKADFLDQVEANVEIVLSALETTQAGLEISQQSLEEASASVLALQLTMETTASAIDDTTPLVTTLVDLSSKDLPASVTAAQTSLAAAQQSAEIIDGFLTALTSIPFVPDDIYNPEVPLSDALGQLSASISNLPQSLETMETSLTTSQQNMESIQADIDTMAADLSEIHASLEEGQVVIAQYETLATELQTRVEGFQARLPGRVNALALVLTFILLWVAISQTGLFSQGLEMANRYSYEPVLLPEEEAAAREDNL